MSFLNWIMLGGVAALSIPLVIHLFNRSRFRVVQWGAMHLLENVVRVNRKRIRIEQLILLLVRCAIPAVLALLMARPVITGWKSLSGDAPSSTVVLLDNSYSMEAGGASGSNFDAAVEQTKQLLSNLKRGSDISVILTGGGAEPIFERPVFDDRTLADQLRLLTPGYGAADTAASMEAGVATLAKMAHAKRDLIIVSDFQQRNWSVIDAAQRQRLTELLAQMDVPASLTFMQVGQAAKENVAIESIAFSRQIIGVGQTLDVRVNLRNHGERAYQNLRVYCRVDANEHAASQVALAGGETAQVLFTMKFDTGGSHLIELEADAPDLKADNRYLAAVNVLEQMPVLLIDGDPAKRGQPLSGDTDFLAIALQPYGASSTGDAKLADLIRTQTVDASQFKPEQLAGQRVAVLANVQKLNDAQLAAIRGFVEQGGGLLVFPGNHIDLAWYNTTFADAVNDLLPMRFESLVDSGRDGRGGASIVAQHYDHTALSLFNDRGNGNLVEAEIRTWYRLAPLETDTKATILARLDTGDPLLAERRIGEGVVMQFATAADADWSNLPMRPIYLPLMQQLVTYLAMSIEPPRNLKAGKPLIAILPPDTDGGDVTLTSPDGGRITLTPIDRDGKRIIEYASTRRPGAYTLHVPGARPMHFVVATSRDESELEQFDREELERLAQEMNASVVHSAAEYVALDAERRHGREVWKMLLLALLGLVFGELLLESAFGGAAKGRAA